MSFGDFLKKLLGIAKKEKFVHQPAADHALDKDALDAVAGGQQQNLNSGRENPDGYTEPYPRK